MRERDAALVRAQDGGASQVHNAQVKGRGGNLLGELRHRRAHNDVARREVAVKKRAVQLPGPKEDVEHGDPQGHGDLWEN